MKNKLVDVTSYIFNGDKVKQIKPNLSSEKMDCETCTHLSDSGITCTLQDFQKQGWGHCYSQRINFRDDKIIIKNHLN